MGDDALLAKVLTVSDGVAHGTRDDASGRALVEQLTGAGFEVVDHRVTEDGADAVAAALTEHDRRLRRPRRHDRRHRLRPAGPDARRAPGRSSSARRRGWPRRCG